MLVLGLLALALAPLSARDAPLGSCLAPRASPSPGCGGSREQLLCVQGWPEGSLAAHTVNVTVLLPDGFYSNEEKACVPESRTQLQANYRRVGPAILAGLEEAHARGWLKDINFNIEFRDTFCDNSLAPKAWEDLLLAGLPVHVLFGPACDYALAAVARLSKYRNIPLITAGGYALDFSDKKTEPADEFYLLSRTGMAWTGLSKMFLQFMKKNKWKKYVVIWKATDHREWNGDNSCYQLASALSSETRQKSSEHGIIMESMDLKNLEGIYYKPEETHNHTREYALRQNMTMLEDHIPGKNSSIFLICASPARTRSLVLAAKRLGMTDSGQYVFFNIENVQNLNNFTPWEEEGATVDDIKETKEAFKSVLTLNLGMPRNSSETNLTRRVKEVAGKWFNYNYTEEVSTLAENFYDAALVYAKALSITLSKKNHSMSNLKDYGEKISLQMANMNIAGASGPVRMNSNRDRQVSYAIMALSEDTHRYAVALTFSPNESVVTKPLTKNCTAEEREQEMDKCNERAKEDDELKPVADVTIVWPGKCSNGIYLAMQIKEHGSCEEGVHPPPDFPLCGFTGDDCRSEGDNVTLIISIVLSIILICVCVIGVFVYRKYKEEAEIARMNWKIDPQEIMTSKESRGRFGSKYSLVSRNSIDSLGCEDGQRQVFVSTVYYRGTTVAFKKIKKDNVNLNRALLLELKQMKDLHHDHLTRFLGASLEPGCSFMITEYCPRGSLQDILEDSDFELDADFRISLINDIVRGMAFIHASEIRYHGNLKSSNCVVDSS